MLYIIGYHAYFQRVEPHLLSSALKYHFPLFSDLLLHSPLHQFPLLAHSALHFLN